MIERRLLARLEQKRARLHALQPLPAAAVHHLNERLTVEWIYNSNAIAGSTLTLEQTRRILDTGLAIGGKTLREHFEVINHRDAIRYVEARVTGDELLSPSHLRQIHNHILMRIDDQAGQYRNVSISIAGAEHKPPDAWEVPRLMREWGDWLAGPALELHPIERAALAHHRLEAIHPFMDGNGRTARLAMNLLLMRDGYPPTIIQYAYRRQYCTVLAQADRGRERALVNYVGRAAERSLTLYLEACMPTKDSPGPEDESILLREAAQGTPYSPEYLGLLARKGRLEAIKRGYNWYTTRRAVATYLESIR